MLNGHLAPSTRYLYASAANSLYQQAASMVPNVDFDAALLAPDFSAIERVLSASLLARQADQGRQKAVRQVAAKFSKSSPALLAERLAAAQAEVQTLKRQRDLLVAGHRAAILAIGRIGGMKAWREYFVDYSGALQDLKELGALPEAEVVRIAPVEEPDPNR
ncbi:hypothetical protein [Brevundimonas nasdae]|uniref:Uncharacterized protein n=1 Tax=Brevundimonas nasdae TaxID=172043 RepID=A0ACD4VI44_9CAUL|nr:hypothetical protein [Brevundimonas nasdae]WOB77650.1 hypothetical protein PZA08_09920 [Brevundimonas nasdae]